MRFFVVGVLAASVAAAGCNRVQRADQTDTTVMDAASKPPSGTPSAAGVAESAPAAWREVTIPAGTALPLVLDSALGSDSSRAEDPVRAHLARGITVQGATVLPADTVVLGTVTSAARSGRVKGRAHLAVRFDTLIPSNQEERYPIATASIARTAPATKKADALKVAAPAAGGAIIGGLIGGGKGAAIGTAAGGGAGTAVVLSTRGKEVRLSRGAAMTIRLVEPLTVRVKA